MPVTLEDRFPEIIAELRPKVGAAVAEGARVVQENAAIRVPDAPPLAQGLIASIHIERKGVAEYAVVAGERDAFYGAFVEFGTSHNAPHPFLVPALEESAESIEALVTAALRGL